MENPLLFNVVDTDNQLLCPVCGFSGYSRSPAYQEYGGEIGTTICPCCLWEPGFDDEASARAEKTILESIRDYREGWAVNKQWQGHRHLRPENFDGQAQLTKLLSIAPYIQ